MKCLILQLICCTFKLRALRSTVRYATISTQVELRVQVLFFDASVYETRYSDILCGWNLWKATLSP